MINLLSLYISICSAILLSSKRLLYIFFFTKTEPDFGSCDDETDCNNNGECINNYCKCKPGFDDKDYPKDCSRKEFLNAIKYEMFREPPPNLFSL